MSHDPFPPSATVQHLPSADDTDFPLFTTHEHERPSGQSWRGAATDDEFEARWFGSCSSYVRVEHYDGIGDSNLAFRPTSQTGYFTSPEHEADVYDFAKLDTLKEGDELHFTTQTDLGQHVTQTQAQEHPGLQHVGMQFDQPYESTDRGSVCFTHDDLQLPDDNADLDMHGLQDNFARNASPFIFRPATASEILGTTVETPTGSTQFPYPMFSAEPLAIPSADLSSGTPDRSARSTDFDALECPYCHAMFRGIYKQGNYGRHRRQKHAGKSITHRCAYPSCTKTFRRVDALRKHYRRHFDINTNDEIPSEEHIRCDICQKEFNRAAELRRHKDSVHNLNLQQYFCNVPGCDRASRPFPRKDKLADHTARVHGQSTTSEAFEHGEEVLEATHRCDYEGCEREFDQRADLLRHQRTHTDRSERPHQCPQCEKSFLYPKDLKRHQATHLDNEDDDKPSFHCEVASCEYGPGKQGFSRKDGMIRHMRRFHPEVIVEKEEV